jgi:hypothetical protein
LTREASDMANGPTAQPQAYKIPNPDEVATIITKFGDAAAAKWQSASWVY